MAKSVTVLMKVLYLVREFFRGWKLTYDAAGVTRTVVVEMTFELQSRLAEDMKADPFAVPATARPSQSQRESLRRGGEFPNNSYCSRWPCC